MSEQHHDSSQDYSEREPFLLGSWLVRPSLLNLKDGDETVHLGRRNMDVLLYLAREPGKVVSRRELLNEVWRDVVVCEEALTRAISELRTALGDKPGSPKYIQTIRKGGYRLLQEPVTPAPETSRPTVSEEIRTDSEQSVREGATAPRPERAPHPEPAPRPTGQRTVPRRLIPWIPLLLLPVILVLLGHWQPVKELITLLSLPKGIPLTSRPGREIMPAISPTSDLVAYCWRAERHAKWQLWLRDPDEVQPRQLTGPEFNILHPTWSPDGSRLAYCRGTGLSGESAKREEEGICLLDLETGEVELVTSLVNYLVGLTWSPDGKELAMATISRIGLPQILLFNLERKVFREFTSPDYHGGGDRYPAYSPDGRIIAFSRRGSFGRDHIYLKSVLSGELRALEPSFASLVGLAWESENTILVTAVQGRTFHLSRIDIAEETLQPVLLDRRDILRPSFSVDDRTLVIESQVNNSDLYSVQLPEPGENLAQPLPLFSTTCDEVFPCVSALDGRLAFISDSSGSPEIYMSDADGDNRQRLTDFDGTQIIRPAWSPIAPVIAFSVSHADSLILCLLDVESREIRELATIGNSIYAPKWSADGEWIYANLYMDTFWEFGRISITTGEQETLLNGYVNILADHPTLGVLFFTPSGSTGLMAYHTETGAQPVPGCEEVYPPSGGCSLSGDHLLMLQYDGSNNLLISVNLVSAQQDTLGLFPDDVHRQIPVSPDGRLYFSRLVSWEGDLILYKDFY
ncbi:MAG: hypothetical protein GY835_12210 [bacterium]|nr:hypothetical protein [bacterium]